MTKKEQIIVDKIGLSEDIAKWIVKLTKKHHIWVANVIKRDPTLYQHKKDEIKLIIDWKKTDQDYNLVKLNFNKALSLANESAPDEQGFKTRKNSLKNKNVYLDLGKYKWVELLTADDCIEEGEAMKHCLQEGYVNSEIARGKRLVYSLRDDYNSPRVSIDMTPKGWIENLFGKANTLVKTRYIKHITDLLEYNDRWTRVNPYHEKEVVAATIYRVLVDALKRGKYDLIERLGRNASYNIKDVLNKFVEYYYEGDDVELISDFFGFYTTRNKSKWVFDPTNADEVLVAINQFDTNELDEEDSYFYGEFRTVAAPQLAVERPQYYEHRVEVASPLDDEFPDAWMKQVEEYEKDEDMDEDTKEVVSSFKRILETFKSVMTWKQ